ncbi:MAG: cysteine--tRNA ligase, partial [Verrucomicrobiota bacterium]
MSLSLYDTLTREIRPVQPIDSATLRFYCCGPTVYGPAHIGNFRTFVIQDVFRRVVEASGTATRHVRNITDVDDKTIRQSQEEDRSLNEFTAAWTERFHEDCAALGILPPHVEPSAVAHLPEQIDLISRLMEKGHAYQTPDGSVYYDVRSFPAYGRLSRLAEREITTGEVDREQADEYERASAADFALWKAARPEDGPNRWPSPWGDGRPGWHIECSAMAIKHLGETFDLHSGGVDLVFPHHENEIAQSEAATGKIFAHHWLHVAHLTVEGRKMSKSLGNLYTLADLANRGFTAMELRYVLISGCYRQPLNFTFAS